MSLACAGRQGVSTWLPSSRSSPAGAVRFGRISSTGIARLRAISGAREGKLEVIHSFEMEANSVRIGSWPNDEVVLQLSLAAIADEVDTGIDLLVSDFGKGADAPPPLRCFITEKVIDLPRQFLQPDYLSRMRGAGEVHVDYFGRGAWERGSVGAWGVATLGRFDAPTLGRFSGSQRDDRLCRG